MTTIPAVFIFMVVAQIALFPVLIWRMTQNSDQAWAIHKKPMLARGLHVERTPEWEQQAKRQRIALGLTTLFLLVVTIRGYWTLWHIFW